jgi:hypothetical protein
MHADILKAKFARLGARLHLHADGQDGPRDRAFALDVRSDSEGEFFDIRVRSSARVELEVIDLRRREQHLLLAAREGHGRQLYLCGHDERHWFVAGVPEPRGAIGNVFGAMEALKPAEVLQAQRRQGLKGKDRYRRKNAAFVRQGEWFFLPMPKLHVEKKLVLFNEPLSRGTGSKPHWAEMLYRKGGETVYVCDEHPQGLTVPAYLQLRRDRPRAKGWNWRHMRRNAEAYVKGKISHADHKTIELYVWHKVLMNTEGQSQAMRHVVFLD